MSDRPVLRLDQLQLAAQMRQRYGCTYGDALRLMVPAAVSAAHGRQVRMAELIDPAEAARRLNEGEIDRLGQQRVLELLLDYGAVAVSEILSTCQVSRAVLQTLVRKELIRFFSQVQDRPTGGGEETGQPAADLKPNAGQEQASPPSVRPSCRRMVPQKAQSGNLFCLELPAAARQKFTCRRPA